MPGSVGTTAHPSRVEEVLAGACPRSAQHIADELIRATDRHANTSDVTDDRTVVVIKVVGT